VRAIGTESLARVRARGDPVRRPRRGHRVGPRRAGARRAGEAARRPASSRTTCSPPRFSGREAAACPVVASCTPSTPPTSTPPARRSPIGDGDVDATTSARCAASSACRRGDLRRAPRPQRQRAGHLPESLDLPRRADPRTCRYVGRSSSRRSGRVVAPPGSDDGRPLVVAGLGTTPMDELPVLQRVVHALDGRPVAGIVNAGRPPRSGRPATPRRGRLTATSATRRCSRGPRRRHPRRARHVLAGSARPPAGVPAARVASSPPTPRPSRASGRGWCRPASHARTRSPRPSRGP
jgi:hypothetical protein